MKESFLLLQFFYVRTLPNLSSIVGMWQ